MSAPGFVAIASDANFATSVERLDAAFAARGIVPMARIDHGAAGTASGLPLASTLLVLFGNPRLGTPLMQQRRSWAIDLPLKLLVWAEAGQTSLGYNDPVWLLARHGDGLAPVIDTMRTLLGALAAEAAGRPCA